MKKKLLSLTLALALCLGLTVPVFAKDVIDATKQDILNTFTICRNGSMDETEGDYLVDAPFKLLGIEDKAIEKEGYYVISKDDIWTITNTGSEELEVSGNTDYELLIQLRLYYPDGEANDEYVFRGVNYYWSNENNFSSTDYLTVVRLKAGESATIPASAFMTAGGNAVDPGSIFELCIDVSYPAMFDAHEWQYYKRYYNEGLLDTLRSGTFYFLVDEAHKAQLDSAEPETPTIPASGTAYPSTQTVDVDGVMKTFQMYARKDEKGHDTNYIRIRDLAMALNGTKAQFNIGLVNGEANIETGKAYVSNGSENTTPFSGERAFTRSTTPFNLNGEAIDLAGILLKDDNRAGYTYSEVKDLAAKLNFNARWDSARQIICIETDKPYSGN